MIYQQITCLLSELANNLNIFIGKGVQPQMNGTYANYIASVDDFRIVEQTGGLVTVVVKCSLAYPLQAKLHS